MNYDVFIPVRLSSKRLPNKAIRKINDREIILCLVDRLKNSKLTRKIIVCTTENPTDDPLVKLLKENEIEYYRGSDKDILLRFLVATEKFDTDYIINVDGDDIYTDPESIDNLIQKNKETDSDYLSFKNLPLGLTPVCIKVEALKTACKLKKTNNTETGYRNFFLDNTNFVCKFIDGANIINFPSDMRFTLDYEEDLRLAKIIFNKLGNNFHWKDLLWFINENPYLKDIIADLHAKWESHWTQNLSNTTLKNA